MEKLKIEAILFKNKLDPIANISDWVTYENLKWEETSSLEIKIPQSIKGIKYYPYNEIKEKRYIVVDNKRRYIIEDITADKDQDNSILNVKAYSLESILEKRYISIESFPHTVKSIFKLIEEVSGWKVNIKDNLLESDVTYNVEGEFKILTLIRDTLEPLYEIHCNFDTINCVINVYDRNNKEYSIYADYDNLIDEIEINNNTDEQITRLINDTDISIALEHIENTEYIEDFSFLIDKDNVTNDLKSALNRYDLFLKSKENEFQNLKNQMNSLENQYASIEENITKQEELVKSKKEEQEKYESDSKEYKALENEINNLEDEIIPGLEKSLENKQIEIDNKTEEFIELGEKVSKENSNCFSEEELLEFNELITESKYTDSVSLSSEDLFNNMKYKLEYLNAPKYEYKLNALTLKKIIDKLSKDINLLGSFFYFKENIMPLDELRIVGYRVNYVDNTIDNIEFSTSKKNENKLDFFGNVVSENSKAKKKIDKVIVSINRIEEGLEAKVTKGDIESIVTHKADKWGLSFKGKLKGANYEFDGTGMTIYNGDIVVKNANEKTILWVDSETGKLSCDSLKVFGDDTNVEFSGPGAKNIIFKSDNNKSLFLNFLRGTSGKARIGIYAQDSLSERSYQLFIEPGSDSTDKMPMVIVRGSNSTSESNEEAELQVHGRIRAVGKLLIGYGSTERDVGNILSNYEQRIRALEG